MTSENCNFESLTRASALEQMHRIGQMASPQRYYVQTQRFPNLIVPFCSAECLILEIAELWMLLEFDGLDSEQIVKNLSHLLLPIDLSVSLHGRLDDIVRQHLVAIDPVNLDLSEAVLQTFLWPAKVWATTFAARHGACRWAEHQILDFKHRLPSTWRLALGPDVPTKRVVLTGALTDLDRLLLTYRYWPIASDIRRLMARSQPTDRLAGFYSPCVGRYLDTAAYGIGLIRRGVMVDRIVTRRRAITFS